MIKMIQGNLFTSRMQTLVNTVNCVGVMGRGIALEFKFRYPAMFYDYAAKCATKKVLPGQPYLYQRSNGKNVLNFPTKRHWHDDSRLKDIEDGLDYFIKYYQEWGITSIAFPPLGCGCGGLSWLTVEPLMTSKLNSIDIPVEIYLPQRKKFFATDGC